MRMLDEDEAVVLQKIKQILEEGLKEWGCEEVRVVVHSPAELEVSVIKDGKWIHFYFG